MGMTGQELSKLIETGQLASTEFLPKFLKQMQDFVHGNGMLEASMKKVSAAQGRMTSMMLLGIDAGFESGRGGFVGFFEDLTVVLEQNQGTIKAFGAIFGAVLNTVSTVIRTVSPVVAVAGSALNTFVDGLKRAADPDISMDKLNGLEAFFRVFAWLLAEANYGLLTFEEYAMRFAKWLGMSEEGASNLGKQFLGFIISLWAFGKAWKIIAGLGNTILGPFKALKGAMDKLIGREATSRVFSLRNALRATFITPFQTAFMWISRILGLFPQVRGMLVALGVAKAAWDVGAWAGEKVSEGTLIESLRAKAGEGMNAVQGRLSSVKDALSNESVMRFLRSPFGGGSTQVNATINVSSPNADPRAVAAEVERRLTTVYSEALAPSP